MNELKIINRTQMSSHYTMYRLSNGWFIARDKYDRDDWTYKVFIPGAHERGCALQIGGARTLRGALVVAQGVGE
jgi:hypothetical protein